MTGDNNHRFKHPTGERYVRLGPLDIFLSDYDGFEIPSEDKNGIKRFDLSEAQTVRLVYPVKRDEIACRTDCFIPHGIKEGVPPIHTVYCSNIDSVPDKLERFIVKEKVGRAGATIRSVIFVLSEPFVRPSIRRDSWHIGTSTKRFVTLQPPGRYCADEITSLFEFNNIVIVERDPGRCLVCRGNTGERIHLGVIRTLPDIVPENLICRKCTGRTFDDWQDALDGYDNVVYDL